MRLKILMRKIEPKYIALFCGLICLLLFNGCSREQGNDQKKPEQIVDNTVYPDQESWNSTLVTTNLGNVNTEIEFGHMAKFNERDEYNFDQNIKVNFFDKNGKLKSNITADKGVLNETTKYMEASGNVIAHSDSANMTLYTEKLQWEEVQEKIISNEFVTITTDMDTLYGIGFESDLDLNNWHIKKPKGRTSRPFDLDFDKQVKKKDNEK